MTSFRWFSNSANSTFTPSMVRGLTWSLFLSNSSLTWCSCWTSSSIFTILEKSLSPSGVFTSDLLQLSLRHSLNLQHLTSLLSISWNSQCFFLTLTSGSIMKSLLIYSSSYFITFLNWFQFLSQKVLPLPFDFSFSNSDFASPLHSFEWNIGWWLS